MKQLQLPVVAAIVVTWNGKEHILRCLECLRRLKYPKKRLQIVIVDNASTDGTQTAIKNVLKRHGKRYLDAQLLALRENVGAPVAINRGLTMLHQKVDFVWKLDNDVTFWGEYLQLLVAGCHSKPSLGAIGGRILDPQGIDQPAGAMLLPAPRRWLGILEYRTAPNLDQQDVSVVLGASCLFPKSVFAEHGVFDERFFLYYDDTEYCLRLKEKGKEIIVVPAAIATHHISSSIGRFSGTQLAYMTRNHILLGLTVFKGFERAVFVLMQLASLPWRILRMNQQFRGLGAFRVARYVVIGFIKALRGEYGQMATGNS